MVRGEIVSVCSLGAVIQVHFFCLDFYLLLLIGVFVWNLTLFIEVILVIRSLGFLGLAIWSAKVSLEENLQFYNQVSPIYNRERHCRQRKH